VKWRFCNSWVIGSRIAAMTFLFKIEEVFEISGRGCAIVPALAEGADFKIRLQDAIQLRTPEGRTRNTHISSVEFLKPEVGTCRMAIMLPSDVLKQDVPKGTDVWLIQQGQ
jgi:translation elongation factor EF-Tu-like GTPase